MEFAGEHTIKSNLLPCCFKSFLDDIYQKKLFWGVFSLKCYGIGIYITGIHVLSQKNVTRRMSIFCPVGGGAMGGDFDIFKKGQNPYPKAHFCYQNPQMGTVYHVKIVWVA